MSASWKIDCSTDFVIWNIASLSISVDSNSSHSPGWKKSYLTLCHFFPQFFFSLSTQMIWDKLLNSFTGKKLRVNIVWSSFPMKYKIHSENLISIYLLWNDCLVYCYKSQMPLNNEYFKIFYVIFQISVPKNDHSTETVNIVFKRAEIPVWYFKNKVVISHISKSGQSVTKWVNDKQNPKSHTIKQFSYYYYKKTLLYDL